MGRHRTPAVLKVLAGNPGCRPIGEEPEALGQPIAPDWLSPDVRAIWDRIVSVMPQSLLRGADEQTLLQACVAAAEFHKLARVAGRVTERTEMAMTPGEINAVRAMGSHMDRFMKAASRLGLSPVDRARLATDPKNKPDPLAEVLSKKPDLNVAQTG